MSKKTFFPLFLLGIFVLSACSEVPASSSSDSTGPAPETSSPGGETSTSEGPSDQDKVEAVINVLESVGRSTTYSVFSEEDDGTGMSVLKLTDIYTPEYISIGFMNGGYLTLPSYDSSLGETLVYDFKYDAAGNVVLGKVVTYYDEEGEIKTLRDCTELDYMKLFVEDPNYALDPSMFDVEAGVITTKNEKLLYVLSHQMGYSPETDDYIITSARFEMDDGKLTFYLYNQIDPDSTGVELLIKATFDDLNATKDEKLEGYIASYEAPSQKLDAESLALFQAETVGFETKIRYRSTSGFVDFGNLSVATKYDAENPNNSLVSYKVEDTINQEKYSYLLSFDENGQPTDHFINGKNEPETQKFDRVGYYLGNGIFPIQEEIDDFFYSDDGSSYKYYGVNIDRLYEAVTAISVLTDLNIKSIDSLVLSKADAKTLVLEAELSAYYEDLEGNQTDLSVNTVSTMLVDPIVEIPSSFASSETSDTLAQAFEGIKNASNYIARGYGLKSDGSEASTLPSNSYYMKKDEYFIMHETSRDYITTIKGYKQYQNTLIPFTVDAQGKVAQSGDVITDQTLGDIVPWNASPDLFEQVTGLTYRVKDHVKNVDEVIFGGSTLNSLIDCSLTLALDDQGRLDKVNYQYVYRGLLSGREELSFEYSSEQAFPDFIDQASFEALDGVTHVLTSWEQEKDSNIYKRMSQMFGVEAADIPYLYDAEVSNTWNLGTNYDGTGDMCIYSSSAAVSAFMEEYRNYIVSLGYAEQTIDGLEYYVKGSIKIRFGDDLSGYDYSDYLYFGLVA